MSSVERWITNPVSLLIAPPLHETVSWSPMVFETAGAAGALGDNANGLLFRP